LEGGASSTLDLRRYPQPGAVEINGNIAGTTGNLYTGGGDVNGGWVL
jgi:hypothetical protein